MSANHTIRSDLSVNNFATNFSAALRRLVVGGSFAGDGILWPDRVEVPGWQRAWDARQDRAGDGVRVLTVGGILSLRGVDTSGHKNDENNDKDGQCGAQSDGQGYCHCGVLAGWRRRLLSGCRQVIAAFQFSRPDYERRQQTKMRTTDRLALWIWSYYTEVEEVENSGHMMDHLNSWKKQNIVNRLLKLHSNVK